MQKPTISEILHRAADEFLAATQKEYDKLRKEKFSCLAITHILDDMICKKVITYEEKVELHSRIREGLQNMGLDIYSVYGFGNNVPGRIYKKQQEARYNWLKFAAVVAEEQGV